METLSKLPHTHSKDESSDASRAALVHLSSFFSLIIPFGGILGPLATWLLWRDDSDLIDQNGKQALNFNISFALYNIAVIVIGLVMFITPVLAMLETDGANPISMLFSLPGLWLLLGGLSLISLVKLILIIVAALQAGNGKVYRYPLSIPFIK